jgi:glycosyltransferase involved in cell wall biosynthesis
MLLVSPVGKMVEIDVDWERWLKDEGFRLATAEEERLFRHERMQFVENVEHMNDPNVLYFQSVSGKGRGDGYGSSSKDLLEAMHEIGIPTSESFNNQNIGLLYHSPYSIMRMETRFRILYTMFESSKIPEDWIEILKLADMVLVPSKWCQKVFQESGITTKVIPLGYNDKVFRYIPRPVRKPFTFLHYDAFNARKGHFEVFNAFNKAFEGNPDVKMIFKTTREQISVPLSPSQYPNIEVIYGDVPQQELYNIMERADGFVFPSRGEGFGLTPLEAMATGLPTIIPNAHGMSEYFDDRYMREVKVGGPSVPLYRRLTDVGEMIKVDEDDLAKQMLWMVDNQDEAMEMGRKASEYVKQWTYVNTATKLKELLNDIKSNPLPARKIMKKLPLERVV